jgi:hypothetical protein
MKSVNVFEVKRVTIRWSAKAADGTEIHGQASSGRLKVVFEESRVSVYLTKKDLRGLYPPVELTEELSKLLGINRTNQALLLHQALAEPDITLLIKTLEKQGIVVEAESAGAQPVPDSDATRDNASTRDSQPYDQEEDLLDRVGRDKMRTFIAELDHIRSVEGLMDRAWMATQTDRILSKACKLDDQDPALFLPMQAVTGYKESGLGLPDEETTWSLQSFRDRGLDWKKRHPGTDFLFEALYLPRTRTVFVSSKNVHNVSEEIAFLGEYSVGAMLALSMRSFRG